MVRPGLGSGRRESWVRRQSAGCSGKAKAAAALLLTDGREWAWQFRSRWCFSAWCWRVPLGGGGGVLCVSTSWAAAREFGPRHTPEPACVLGPKIAASSRGAKLSEGTQGEPEGPQVYMLQSRRPPQGYCASRQIPNTFAVIDPPEFPGGRNRTVTPEQTIAATTTNARPAMAAQEPNPNGPSTSTTSPANIFTYHCLCTQLSLATTASLESLPKRQLDAAAIATLGDFASASKPTLTMQALSVDDKAAVLKLDDGFEKRYAVRCTRCGLAAGYHLDKGQFGGTESQSGPRTDVVYILPGGLLTTEEMREGRSMDAEVGKVALAATS